MVTVNKTMNDDIKEFGVYELYYNRLRPRPDIQSIHDYQHGFFDLHHYIKAQDYRRNREWYEFHGIRQKLILLPRVIHTHLEDPIYSLSANDFYSKYHIAKDILLFDKRKWLNIIVERRKV